MCGGDSLENCFYDGSEVCVYQLKDKHGIYKINEVENLKLAAAKGLLRCTDCGERVYLAAGPIKEPYFAHYDLEACSYQNSKESEELKKGKRLLYHMLLNSFQETQVHVRHRLPNGFYSTLYVEGLEYGDIAIEYRLQNLPIQEFIERDEFYMDNRILPIYILGNRLNKTVKQISWYENQIQKSQGFVAYLDVSTEKLILKKCYDYMAKGKRQVHVCQGDYSVTEVKLNANGEFLCNFQNECNLIEEEIRKYEDKLPPGILPEILETAREYIRTGNGHLVSQKYLDYIQSTEEKMWRKLNE